MVYRYTTTVGNLCDAMASKGASKTFIVFKGSLEDMLDQISRLLQLLSQSFDIQRVLYDGEDTWKRAFGSSSMYAQPGLPTLEVIVGKHHPRLDYYWLTEAVLGKPFFSTNERVGRSSRALFVVESPMKLAWLVKEPSFAGLDSIIMRYSSLCVVDTPPHLQYARYEHEQGGSLYEGSPC